MKLTLGKNHHYYFEKEGMIEFDALVPHTLLEKINTAVDNTISLRLPGGICQADSAEHCDKIMAAGRDLWRSCPAIQQLASRSTLAHIAEELMLCSPVRLGYDQLFTFPPSSADAALALQSASGYLSLSRAPLTFKEISCIQGIFGGLMICLIAPDRAIAPSDDLATTPFSHTAGNGVFFSGDLPLAWPQLFAARPGARYLLIAYCEERSVYVQMEDDPNRHALREMGFVFGDRLNERSHPILKR